VAAENSLRPQAVIQHHWVPHGHELRQRASEGKFRFQQMQKSKKYAKIQKIT
jgi:hypothetical protein